MREDTSRLLGQIHLIVEICVAIGFLLGMIPFLYGFSSQWVIPLTLISLVMAFFLRNGTLTMSVLNVIMALVGLVPILGFLPRLAGAVISFINISTIRRGKSFR